MSEAATAAAGAGCDAVAPLCPEQSGWYEWRNATPRRRAKHRWEQSYIAANGDESASFTAASPKGDLTRFDRDVIQFWGVFVERRTAIAVAYKWGDEAALVEALEENIRWDVDPVPEDDAVEFLDGVLYPDAMEALVAQYR